MSGEPGIRARAPPDSEAELLENARAIAGLSLGALAAALAVPLPRHPTRDKGWTGQLIERALGASAGSLSEPDFQRIGVELKTLPVNAGGRPRESTYVSVVPLDGSASPRWEDSGVLNKLRRVLWQPVVVASGRPLAERRLGTPLLWSPSAAEAAALRADWEELMDRVCLGQLESITAHEGTCLQIRPKAANARARRWGVGESGAPVRTLPRGFYLRPSFTAALLARHYAL